MAHTSSLKIANELLRAGKLDDARKEYQTLIELRPNFSWSYYYLGQMLAQENQWPDAIANYKRAIKLNPNSAYLHNSLAEALIQQGELDEAINSSKKAISLEPNLAIYHQTLALAYEAKSDLGRALTTWQKILVLNPSHMRATQKISWLQTDVARDFVESGEELNKEGKIEEAVEFYQQVLILNPQHCGDRLITLGRFKEAETVFQQLKELYPEQPDGYELLAKLAHHNADWELALKSWSEAIAKFPEKVGFQVKKGEVLIKLSRFDEAEAVFQGLKEKYPDRPQGYESYAELTHHLADWELALSRWEEAIAKFPYRFNFYMHKGNVLINLFRYEEAETWWEKVIDRYPDRHEGLFKSAALARRLGNREFAWQRFEQMIKKFPWHIPAYCEAAQELIAMGRFAEAEEKFLLALQRNPKDLTALLQGGILASQHGSRELALERFELIIEYYSPQKTIDAYILAATELKYLGREGEAIAKYEQIISFHQQRGLYPKPKLLGTRSTFIQEIGLLLDRLVTKKPDSAEDVISLARLIDGILFHPKLRSYRASVDRDASSLLPKLKILKELFEQIILAEEDCEESDLLVLKHFALAIELLKKESQRLNSSEWARIKLVRSEISLPSMDKLCFEGLSSSARYVIGTDEPWEKSKRQAAVKYLPELMDEEKEYFDASIWKHGRSLKLTSQQTIGIFKDFICEPPYGISAGHILPYYHQGVCEEFINELNISRKGSATTIPTFQNRYFWKASLDREHTGNSTKNLADVAVNITDSKIDPLMKLNFPDTRGFLDKIATSEKALNNYYEDDVVFGIPNVWQIWGAYENYGHLLLDQIPSLILYQKLNLSCKIFVPHITNSHWEIFNALNIPKDKILVKQEQKFKYFLIGRYEYDAGIIHFYRKLRESILAKRSDIPSEYRARYVYISRRYSTRRPMINEVEVEELMVSLGFSIVYAERLSFEEKALLMNHASFVVGSTGTGHLNCVMCHPNTTIVDIIPPDFFLSPYNFKMCSWGEYSLYPLLGQKTANGWETNIDKLKKVITAILEGK